MDVLFLGVAAIVLIALTLWIVWRPSNDTVRTEEESPPMIPQGDRFEDQYTSATADLSAGGVAVTTAASDETTLRTEGEPPPAALPPAEPTPALAPPVASAPPPRQLPSTVGAGLAGAAAALTLGGAAAGAWLYARWQRERNKPLNRLRRRFR